MYITYSVIMREFTEHIDSAKARLIRVMRISLSRFIAQIEERRLPLDSYHYCFYFTYLSHLLWNALFSWHLFAMLLFEVFQPSQASSSLWLFLACWYFPEAFIWSIAGRHTSRHSPFSSHWYDHERAPTNSPYGYAIKSWGRRRIITVVLCFITFVSFCRGENALSPILWVEVKLNIVLTISGRKGAESAPLLDLCFVYRLWHYRLFRQLLGDGHAAHAVSRYACHLSLFTDFIMIFGILNMKLSLMTSRSADSHDIFRNQFSLRPRASRASLCAAFLLMPPALIAFGLPLSITSFAGF